MPGRRSVGPSSARKPQPKKSKKQRSLNALAIAEKTVNSGRAPRQNRLGDSEDIRAPKRRYHSEEDEDALDDERPKRRKRDKIDPEDENAEAGSDSSGNEWVTGQVNNSDDSELDSDDALAASDEERFEGFAFRGGSGEKQRQRRSAPAGRKDRKVDSEDVEMDEDDDDSEDFSEEDDFGGEGVDLADVLDEDPMEGSDGISGGLEQADGLPLEKHDSKHAHSEESLNVSFSDDEVDSRDTRKLAKLQDMVNKLKDSDANVNLQKGPDPLESMTPSEFAIPSKRKLTLADLEATVTDPGLRKSLKFLSNNDSKPSNRKGIPQKLDAPLPKRQQDRIDRTAAYDKTKETLGRWVDTVKHNRRAEHLSFPLPDPDGVIPQGQNRLLPNTNAKPVTDLESTIRSIMEESGMIGKDGKPEEDQIRAFEELETKDMPYEEVLARRAELRQRRDLLFREERRAKRIKKIKSKQYRKIHRKERERNALNLRNALIDNDNADSANENERNDRRRAEERMGAKHRDSRWAKGVKASGRTTWDADAREGVMEMARRGEELKRRIEGKTPHEEGGDESTSESDDSASEDVGKNPVPSRLRRVLQSGTELESAEGSLAGMAFMKRAEKARKERNNIDAEALRQDFDGGAMASESGDEGTQGAGRRAFGPVRSKKSTEPDARLQRSEFEELAASDDETHNKKRRNDVAMDRVVIDTGRSRPLMAEASNGAKLPQVETLAGEWNRPRSVADTMSGNPNAESTLIETSKLPRSALKGSRAAERLSKGGTSSVEKATTAIEADQLSDENSEAGEPIVMSNAELARRAFAGDDVLDQKFQEEKAELTQEQGDQIIDETLPGWGAWTGIGVSKKQSAPRFRKLRKKQGIAPESRKDAKLKDVIISEKTVKKNGKYLAGQLPHPFETKAQYERSLRLPVGPEWTTKETFQDMTKPRILMKQGIIAPMVKPMV